MTDEILDILCPERAIDDTEARSLLVYAQSEHPDAWSAFRFIEKRSGLDDACLYLRQLDDAKLHRLADVMPRLDREAKERTRPQSNPTVAPNASSVSIAMNGGHVSYGATMDDSRLPFKPEN